MITEISRTLNGIYYASNNSILFTSNPYLLANNNLTIYFNNDSRVSDVVSSVSGNSAFISLTNQQYDNTAVTVITQNFGSGLSGPQPQFSIKSTPPANILFQGWSSLGGSANVQVQVTTDPAGHWITLGTLALNSANSNTAYLSTTLPWAYGRLNILDIAAGNSISVNKAI